MKKTVTAEDIRIFKIGDAAQYLPKIDQGEAEEFYEEVADNSDEVYAVGYGDEIIGLEYIGCEKRDFAYVYLFPEYRGRGLGYHSALAAERALPPTVEAVETGYDLRDGAAKALAEKMGYRRKFASAKMVYEGGLLEESPLPVREYRNEDFLEAWTLSAEAFHRMRMSTGCFPESTVGTPSDEKRAYWTETANERLVLELDGGIVGCAQISGNELSVVSIKISRQGEGLGRKFVSYLVNRIIEKKIGAPVLWCVVGNDKARNLYESLGFREIRRYEYAEKKLDRADE